MLQIKELGESIKKMLNKQNKKKVIENTVIIAIIGVIIIIAGGSLFRGDGGNKGEAAGNTAGEQSAIEASNAAVIKDDMESELEAILEQMEGVGKVNVMVTFITGKEIIPAYDTKESDNETVEKDKEGGTRNINQSSYESSIAYEEGEQGARKPVVIKDLQPIVKGVVVVAEGAGDPVVKDNLCRAVQVLTDVPIHKISVFERKK